MKKIRPEYVNDARVLTALRGPDKAMTTSITLLALRVLHDAVDDLNAAEGTSKRLCLLCGALCYDMVRGIVHSSECALVLARYALAQEKEE